MDNYSKNYQLNFPRNLPKRSSYQNIYEIRDIIQNFNSKFDFGLLKDSSIIEPYTNKNISIFNLNNNLNKKLFDANKKLHNGNTQKIYSFKRKRISSSYFDKIRNLYFFKQPTLLSGRIITKKRNLINKKINISNNNKNNKIKISNKYYLPKISNDRKDLIVHLMNKRHKLLSLENCKSYSVGSIGNKNDFINNNIKLPRVKSTIAYNNKIPINNRILSRNKKPIRCNSSISKPNLGVKSIYMSFGITPKKEKNYNFYNKVIFLKKYNKRYINNEENKNIKNDNNDSKGLNNNLNDENKIINQDENITKEKEKEKKKEKEKGKEYNFNQNFKQVNIENLHIENDNNLLNDKGTLIGPFFN